MSALHKGAYIVCTAIYQKFLKDANCLDLNNRTRILYVNAQCLCLQACTVVINNSILQIVNNIFITSTVIENEIRSTRKENSIRQTMCKVDQSRDMID